MQQQKPRPVLNFPNGYPAWSKKWRSTKRMLGKPNLKWSDYWRSSGRLKMKRTTRRRRSVNWRGEFRGWKDARQKEISPETSPLIFKVYSTANYVNLPISTNTWDFILFSFIFIPFSPSISPFISSLISALFKRVHLMHPSNYSSVWVCLRSLVCVCVTITLQKALCVSSVAFTAAAKTGPSPC